jgi:hypothetical protein
MSDVFDGVLRRLFGRLPVPFSVTADDEDAQLWYKTTQVYVAGIRRSCAERLEESGDEGTRGFRIEAERGAEIVRTRRGAGERVGASEDLLAEMERAETLLNEAADGYADEDLFDSLRSVEETLAEECPR